MVGYLQPCRYCKTLVEGNASFCPKCGKVNPAGPFRCPVCRNPIRKQFAMCSDCGLPLKVSCPKCGKETFLGDYCEQCEARLTVTCPDPKCGEDQPPGRNTCLKCGKPL